MTTKQRELARHALGLGNGSKQTYRNHFVAGPGHPDYEDWLAMETSGLAKRRTGSPISGGDDIFWLTKIGAELALDRSESLHPEDFRS